MSVSEVVFYLLGALAVASAALVVLGRNPVASLLFLVLCFFAIAGLFATLEAHFLAAIQILVYAGAILVLFLFVIMLLNLGTAELWPRLPRRLRVLLAAVAGVAFVALLVLTFQRSAAVGGAAAAELEPPRGPSAAASTSIESAPDDLAAVRSAAGLPAELELDEVGADETAPEEIGAGLEPAARRAPGVRRERPGPGRPSASGGLAEGRPVVGSTEAVGVALFRDFLLPFEITSLVLLVAMVGAVMLAKRER